jgi:hypothetical protein
MCPSGNVLNRLTRDLRPTQNGPAGPFWEKGQPGRAIYQIDPNR